MLGALYQMDLSRGLLRSCENLFLQSLCMVSHMLRFFVKFSILKAGLGQTAPISGEWNMGLGGCWPNFCSVLISKIHAGYLAWFPFNIGDGFEVSLHLWSATSLHLGVFSWK